VSSVFLVICRVHIFLLGHCWCGALDLIVKIAFIYCSASARNVSVLVPVIYSSVVGVVSYFQICIFLSFSDL